MSYFEFYKDGDYAFSFRTDKTILQIGRSAECDFVFEDPSLSRVHAILRRRHNRWEIEDTSKNGLYKEGGGSQEVTRHLELGAFYHLSKRIKFRFLDQLKLSGEPTLLLQDRATQILESKEDHLTLGEGQLTFRDQEGQIVNRAITSQGLSIGSHPSNDLQLQADTVSQFHANFRFKNQTFYVRDLDSTNGTFVDGIRVQEIELSKDAEIRIGSLALKFEIKRQDLRILPKNTTRFFGLVTKQLAMKRLFSKAEIVAATTAPVALVGETGTGKELLAKAIHEISKRQTGPYIPLNCAALPQNLIESELFGYEKGAFTGANEAKPGAFEAANGGTLFLDEIGEMPLEVQAKLLRVLETGEVKRIGSQKMRQVDVRILSATHRQLGELVEKQSFREDLYFRLHVIPLEIPPLRERLQDLEVLVPHLLTMMGYKDFKTSTSSIEKLRTYHFPGNIRELKNILQRACLEVSMRTSPTEPQKIIAPSDLSFLSVYPQADALSPEERDRRAEIIRLLEKNRYSQTKVAKELGWAVSTLHDRIRRWQIPMPKRRVA